MNKDGNIYLSEEARAEILRQPQNPEERKAYDEVLAQMYSLEKSGVIQPIEQAKDDEELVGMTHDQFLRSMGMNRPQRRQFFRELKKRGAGYTRKMRKGRESRYARLVREGKLA